MATALDLCSLAWGAQEGYVCLAVRDPTKGKKERGYWKDLTFKWPDEKQRIAVALDKAKDSPRDVYWSPAVYAAPTRSRDAVTKVTSLWADLDEADPKSIPKHLKPTAVWESSPGRWQALWKLTSSLLPDLQQDLNQRLSYALGADRGGWDMTQVLRVPDSHNHKYEEEPLVNLTYMNGHTLDAVKLVDDLPSVMDITKTDDAKLPDPFMVLKSVKLNARLRTLLKARHAEVGTRSDKLWELECLLAERGLEAQQIAAVCQATVWNKFADRHDEVRRLLTEAAKAIQHVGHVEEVVKDDAILVVDDEVPDVGPQTWKEFDAEHKAITWLVAEVWGESEVGFISGLPKSYKSWLALDLAVSVSTGTAFLGNFQARRHNVLLIQEEDPKPVLQDRLVKIAATKGLITVDVDDDTHISYNYALPDNLHVISNQGFTISDEWLEMLEAWIIERDVKLCILDPLMMIAGGGFDEFKAFEFMEKVLKPLKRIRARTGSAVVLVHHHIKQSADAGARAMYGSVALWAWEEAALHLQVSGVGKVTAERFSKHSLLSPLIVEIGDVRESWSPTLSTGAPGDIYDLLVTMEAGATVDELTFTTHLGRDAVTRQLRKLKKEGKVEQSGQQASGSGKGRPKQVWKVKGAT